MNCNRCGTLLSESAKFCASCGAPVQDIPEVHRTPPPLPHPAVGADPNERSIFFQSPPLDPLPSGEAGKEGLKKEFPISHTKKLSDLFGKKLLFIHPNSWKRAFELWDGNEIIGTLTYPKVFSPRADASIFDTKCEFHEPKWWKNIVEIREPGKSLPLASFQPSLIMNKVKLELPHEESLCLSSTLMSRRLEIFDKYDARLVSFKKRKIIDPTYEIQIEKSSETLDRNPWVLLLIIYVEISKNRSQT